MTTGVVCWGMVDMRHLVSGPSLRATRERIGLSQGEVAAKVRELSGGKFTQQSLAKFEKSDDARSSYAIYIIRALEILERERLPAGVASLSDQRSTPSPGGRPLTLDQLEEAAMSVTPAQVLSLLQAIAPTLTPEQRILLARAALAEPAKQAE